MVFQVILTPSNQSFMRKPARSLVIFTYFPLCWFVWFWNVPRPSPRFRNETSWTERTCHLSRFWADRSHLHSSGWKEVAPWHPGRFEWNRKPKSSTVDCSRLYLSFQFTEVILVLFLRNGKVLRVKIESAGKPSESDQQTDSISKF